MGDTAQPLLSSDFALINRFCGSQFFHKNHLTVIFRAGIIARRVTPGSHSGWWLFLLSALPLLAFHHTRLKWMLLRSVTRQKHSLQAFLPSHRKEHLWFVISVAVCLSFSSSPFCSCPLWLNRVRFRRKL
jgi:hypothetical protein